MEQISNAKKENRLMTATLFVFFVSGASSVLMGNLMPFLREKYDISYAHAGLLLSLPSWGNLASIFITGYLPTYIGRRKTVLMTSVWMAVAFILVGFGIGGAALLPVACALIGIARGGNTNFSNTMMSTLPGKKSAIGYNLLHGAFAVGAVLSPLALIACTRGETPGWRFMTGGIVVLCLVQLAVYAMTLANRGTRYSATFLDRVVSADYRSLVFENKKQILSTYPISDAAYEAYSTGMQMVAHSSGGTAYKVFKDYPINICAKTGTADAGTNDVNAAFICYAPAEDPEIVIAIYGENAGHGSAVAGIAKSILDVYFEIGESADVDSSENQVS